MRPYYHSNGKLLLTGEYAVLDGALALAVPTTFGQSMRVSENELARLHWRSIDADGNLWFEGFFDLGNFALEQIKRGDKETGQRLAQILSEAKKLNPQLGRGLKGIDIESRLEFPSDWGLGSSSTLINNIAQWSNTDAYELLKNTFGGSGFDIACAQKDKPVLFRRQHGHPVVQTIDFNPSFKDSLYFIHLKKKQDSRAGIAQYRTRSFDRQQFVTHITEITQQFLSCIDLSEFELLLNEHEKLVSGVLGIKTIKESQFSDFRGSIKSLGAWGGDFVLATGGHDTPDYFDSRGFGTVLRYEAMVKKF